MITSCSDVLATYPGEKDIIFVEDDALLLDPNLLIIETCMVKHYTHQIYSFFRTSRQKNTCIYQYGTVAFYASRKFIEDLTKLDLTTICRLPIDMYIAANGPWYATKSYMVKHNDTRYRGQVNARRQFFKQ